MSGRGRDAGSYLILVPSGRSRQRFGSPRSAREGQTDEAGELDSAVRRDIRATEFGYQDPAAVLRSNPVVDLERQVVDHRAPDFVANVLTVGRAYHVEETQLSPDQLVGRISGYVTARGCDELERAMVVVPTTEGHTRADKGKPVFS